MNGGGSTSSTANEDWLITPRIDVNTVANLFSFKGRYRFAGLDMEVKYSTDYTGAGDPNAATWSDVQGIAFSAADSNVWATKTAILPSGTPLFVAFKYMSSATSPSNGREWSVDSVMFNNGTSIMNTHNKAGLPVSVLGAAQNGHILIGFDMPTADAVTINITDISGRVVYTQQTITTKGNNKVLLEPSTLQAGMYFIRVYNNNVFGITKSFVE
jgi:hypothetical protein